MSLLPDK
jgi:hypothetical protein